MNAINEAVEKERQRCLEIAIQEYQYWKNANAPDGISIGAMGAAANISAEIMMPGHSDKKRRALDISKLQPRRVK